MAKHDVASVDQGHLAPEFEEDAGEFIGDIAAADDDDALRQLVEQEHLVGGDRMLDAFDVRKRRAGAGGDQDLARAQFLAAGEPDAVGACQLRALVEDRDIVVGQCVGVGALDPGHFGEHIVAQHRPVEALGRDVPAEHRGIVQVLGKMGAVDEQLLGHAAADDAGPADPILLGHRDPGAMR